MKLLLLFCITTAQLFAQSQRAVVYSAGSWSYLDGLSLAFSVNDSGDTSGTTTGWKAALYSSGMISELAGSSSFGVAINSSGQIAGWKKPSGAFSPNPFLWDSGNLSNFTSHGKAHALSDSGVVVGGTRSCTWNSYSFPNNWEPGEEFVCAAHAFKWDGATLTDLGTLGGDASIATAVNSDASVIVGLSYTATPTDGRRLFRYASGSMSDLGRAYEVHGVNGDGVIVGCRWAGGALEDPTARTTVGANQYGQAYRAFYYDDGSFHEIALQTGDVVNCATAINGTTIVGYGLPSGHPWLYTIGGSLVDIHANLDRVYAMGINSDGVVVGFTGP